MDRLFVVTDILVGPGTGLVLSPPLTGAVTLEVGDRLVLKRPSGELHHTSVVALVKAHDKTRIALPMTPPFEVGTEVYLQEEESAIIAKGTARPVVPAPDVVRPGRAR